MTRPGRISTVLFISFALLAGGSLVSTSPARAADGQSDTKKSLKKFGNKMKDFGKKVGEAGKEAGEEIAEAARKVFYKGKKVSQPLLEKTQRATKEFWHDLIRAKEKTAGELREENERLRRELEEDE